MMEPISGYEDLYFVLEEAFKQATEGKGAERHARGNQFHKQHMQSISTLLGSHDGMAFQAIKKLTEGLAFTDPDRRDRELLGVIVYVAGIIVWHREQEMRPVHSGPAVPPTPPTMYPLCEDCLEYHSSAIRCAPVAAAMRNPPPCLKCECSPCECTGVGLR